MLTFLVTRGHAYTMEEYLRTWGKRLRPRVAVVPYDATGRTAIDPGACIFADLERLSERQLDAADELFRWLSARGMRCLNDPSRALRRAELLQSLAASNDNDFRVFGPAQLPADARFPVFLREIDEHTGPLTPLLRTRSEVASAFARLIARGYRPASLLAVEYLDTADAAGLYRKFAYFRIGRRIISRHVFFDYDFVVKGLSNVDEAMVEEERRFIEERPHAAWARSVFDRAGIEYGRMDFAFCGERPQVWEINTNPMISSTPNDTQPLRQELQELFTTRARRAFRVLSEQGVDGAEGPMTPPRELVAPLAGASGLPRGAYRARRALGERVGVRLAPALGAMAERLAERRAGNGRASAGRR